MTKIIVGLVIIAIAALYFQSKEKLAEKQTQDKAPIAMGSSATATRPGFAPPEKPTNSLMPSPPQNAPAAKKAGALPMERNVTDAQGRALQGIVLGKASNTIGFRRIADQKEFVIPISRLSSADQAFLQGIPDQNREEIERIVAEQKLNGRIARWNSDYEFAMAEAKKYNLPIYMIFTGPDWCPPCKSMERNILNTTEFREFADRRLVLLKILVPAKGRLSPENKALAAKHSVDSYPFVVITSANGKHIYQKAGGYDDLPAYIAMLGRELAGPGSESADR